MIYTLLDAKKKKKEKKKKKKGLIRHSHYLIISFGSLTLRYK
jgi:hypothetical protein